MRHAVFGFWYSVYVEEIRFEKLGELLSESGKSIASTAVAARDPLVW
jgi:hypothetical protein